MKEKSRVKRTQKGSLTVEASIILPLVIIIIALLLYLSFFLYNRCVIAQMSYIAALRGSLSEEKDDRITEQNIRQEGTVLLNKRLLAQNSIRFDNTMASKEVTVSIVSHMRVPFTSLANEVGVRGTWRMEAGKTVKRIDPIDFIRGCRILENATDG
ncbi:MAG: TadE/TadG family type IV pilus assembly protein [Lachnospiraceae bacterium]